MVSSNMSQYQGKILIAKERVTLTGVRLLGQTQKSTKDTGFLLPGQAVICMLDAEPRKPLVILYQELTWHAGSIYFTIAKPSEKFSGMSFCFTGKGEHDRAYYKALVELHEGVYESGVTRSTTHLVGGPWIGAKEASTKMKAAKNLRIPILTYEDFQEMAE